MGAGYRIRWVRGFIALLMGVMYLLPTGCTFGDEPGECPYNVRIEYWSASSSIVNTLPLYVTRLSQYLFDAEGRLLQTTVLRGDSVTGWQGNLPDGDYTLVLWGNLEQQSEVRSRTEPGMQLQDMVLSAAIQGVPPGYRGNTERLYYGTLTFSVGSGTTQRHRVYLSHAHASLSITVRWMDLPPPEDGTFRMRLRGIPSEYGFAGGIEGGIPSGDGSYTLPSIGRPTLNHETRAAMNYENEVRGEFVTYRYTSGTHQLWSLWRNDQQIVKELDLSLFFKRQSIDMDTNIEQVFDLQVLIYNEPYFHIIVGRVSGSDWDEGGGIG